MGIIHKRIRLVCLLALALLVLLSVGVAYGRYSSTRQETLAFQAAQNDAARAIEIRSDGGWTSTAAGVELTFSLANAADTAGQSAILRLTATEGLDPAACAVTLTVGDAVYTGIPYAVQEGTPLYAQMGAGTEYRFHADDTELVWPVSDGQTYTLAVTGEADASLLRLTATETIG